ncbi:MAG: hypothetical protein ACI81W_003436, partial [Saprospiraceae bacterium]
SPKKRRDLLQANQKRDQYHLPISIDDYVHQEWDSPNKSYITNMYIEDFSNGEKDHEFELRLNKLVEALKADRRGDTPYSLL